MSGAVCVYKQRLYLKKMNASTWRSVLMGTLTNVYRNRISVSKTILGEETTKKVNEEIEKDMPRTFPCKSFFQEENIKEQLLQVLQEFSLFHPGIGYFQGLCFLVYPLFYVYYLDNPRWAKTDTYYSLIKLIKILRPVLPLHEQDTRALHYIKTMKKIIEFKLALKDNNLYSKVKEYDLTMLLVVQMLPSLFANRFTLEDTLLLWNYIFSGPTSDGTLLDKIVNVFVGFIIYHKYIYMWHSYEDKLTLPQNDSNNNALEIIKIIKTF